MGERLDGTEITEALVRQIEAGSNWVERRDAATSLTMMIREGLLALRKTAEDKDPDVAHECRKAVETIQSDLTASPQNIELELASALRAYRADLGGSRPEPADAREATALAAGAATVEDLTRWLREIAEARLGELTETEGQWRLELRLSDDRRQTMYIDPGRKDSAGHPVAVMYTLCGPAEPKVFGKALKTNMELSHAAFGVIKQGDRNLLTLISRRRIGELTRASLEETLEYLAKKGDRAESQLQADDEH